ncbi:MAG TPA: hypothetical protein DCG75_14730 [Bacteroidales bacterium]|nr:hypothetical protein [Bacteroidales bacterium]
MMKKLSIILIAMVLFTNPLICQEKADTSMFITVNGVIVDGNGEALTGVTILEEGTANGTVTDINGSFSLTITKDAKLTISYVGFTTVSIDLKGFQNIRFNISDSLIQFCCTNHSPGHCAETMDEMEECTDKYACTFN